MYQCTHYVCLRGVFTFLKVIGFYVKLLIPMYKNKIFFKNRKNTIKEGSALIDLVGCIFNKTCLNFG